MGRRGLLRFLCHWPKRRYRPLAKRKKKIPTEKAMSTWAERVHRGAVNFSHVVTSCGHPNMPYPRRLDKVKFGVPLDEVCKNDIPGSLLVLILKLNKEAPVKKDVFRAPGNQANMKKLIHFLQAGRLVNIDNFSVYTIASVLKKFLRKLPNGIFGRDGEQALFEMIELDEADQRERIHRLVVSLPSYTQRLLVLLFGTFRVIATNAERAQTGMTSEALGVSVAPSFFHTCVSDGKQARMEDVQRFKVATKIMKMMIDNFGVTNLFGRENYEFYARITGRVLKVDDDWIFSFRYPPDAMVSLDDRVLKISCALRIDKPFISLKAISHQEESQSTPALISLPGCHELGSGTASLGMIPENNLLTTESYTRLSTSLEENGLFKGSSSCSSANTSHHHITLEELRNVNRYAENTKSLSLLPQPNSFGLLPELQSVHERQAARMRTRSEWFLTPLLAPSNSYAIDTGRSSLCYLPLNQLRPISPHSSQELVLSASADSVQKRPSVRRAGSKPIHRSSSKRNKENGSKKWKKTQTDQEQEKRTLKDGGNIQTYSPEIQRKCQKLQPDGPAVDNQTSNPTSPVHSFSVSYNPRI